MTDPMEIVELEKKEMTERLRRRPIRKDYQKLHQLDMEIFKAIKLELTPLERALCG